MVLAGLAGHWQYLKLALEAVSHLELTAERLTDRGSAIDAKMSVLDF